MKVDDIVSISASFERLAQAEKPRRRIVGLPKTEEEPPEVVEEPESPEEDYPIHPTSGKKIKPAPPPENLSDEELEQLMQESPSFIDPAKAARDKAIDTLLKEAGAGAEQQPDLVGLSIDGQDNGYWLYDKGLGKYRQANMAVGIEMSQKDLTEKIRELQGV